MLVIDASVLVDALLVAGPARERLASDNLQAPELIDAELLSVLRRPAPPPQPLSLAPGLGAAHQPLRLRRPIRGPGRAA
jgi:predicted nucleic acid-binding protein